MRTITIKTRIRQVEDGRLYDGSLGIGLLNSKEVVTIDFELRFMMPIGDISRAEWTPPIEEAREKVSITLKKAGVILDLKDEEYAFFFNLLVDLAFSFFSQVQKFNQHPIVHDLITRQGLIVTVPAHVIVSLSRTSELTAGVPSEIISMLGASKFGCKLD